MNESPASESKSELTSDEQSPDHEVTNPRVANQENMSASKSIPARSGDLKQKEELPKKNLLPQPIDPKRRAELEKELEQQFADAEEVEDEDIDDMYYDIR